MTRQPGKCLRAALALAAIGSFLPGTGWGEAATASATVIDPIAVETIAFGSSEGAAASLHGVAIEGVRVRVGGSTVSYTATSVARPEDNQRAVTVQFE